MTTARHLRGPRRCVARPLSAGFVLIGVMSAVLMGSPASASDRLYHIEFHVPNPPTGAGLSAAALNNHAQVVGDRFKDAFFWDRDSGLTWLGFLTRRRLRWSWATALNDLGHVTGYSRSEGGLEAYLWTPAKGMIGLGDLPGGSFASRGIAINNLDQIAGHSRSGSGQGDADEAFLWDRDSGMVPLGDLPGGSFISIPFDINDHAQIVGWSISGRGLEPFLWSADAGMIGLGGIDPGIVHGFGVGINNHGQVVGSSDSLIGRQAFLWDPENGMVGLGLVPGPAPASGAVYINDHGVVTGWFLRDLLHPSFEAFIWDAEHGMRPLQDLLDVTARPPFANTGAGVGLNIHGQTLGYDWLTNEIVVLTPFVLADMNCDDAVNAGDVDPFFLALVDYARYEVQYPNCHGDWAGNVNQDARFDAADIDAFFTALGGG